MKYNHKSITDADGKWEIDIHPVTEQVVGKVLIKMSDDYIKRNTPTAEQVRIIGDRIKAEQDEILIQSKMREMAKAELVKEGKINI